MIAWSLLQYSHSVKLNQTLNSNLREGKISKIEYSWMIETITHKKQKTFTLGFITKNVKGIVISFLDSHSRLIKSKIDARKLWVKKVSLQFFVLPWSEFFNGLWIPQGYSLFSDSLQNRRLLPLRVHRLTLKSLSIVEAALP